MKQKQIFTIKAATDAAELILGGIAEVGGAILLPHNSQANINTDLVNTIMACGNHDEAKHAKPARRNTLLGCLEESTDFIRSTRDVFKPVFGTEYSELFAVLGFQGSLALPRGAKSVKRMLQAIKAHLAANPTLEVGTLITAARAQALLEALLAAQLAVEAQQVTVKTLKNVRDDKFKILRKRVTSVYQELRMQLDPLDERWGNFGFKPPGAEQTPDIVTGVKVALIGPTAAAVKWEASARAGHYRIWIRVLGVNEDYVAVSSPADLDFTLENLPAASTVDILVSAVNSGGEGARSEAVRIVTH